MLRRARSKILVLDEATSNADRETDRGMQKIIRQEFAHHTILTVAHRLDTIIDSDVVVVLDKGKVVEVGKPHESLKKEGGVFRELAGHCILKVVSANCGTPSCGAIPPSDCGRRYLTARAAG